MNNGNGSKRLTDQVAVVTGASSGIGAGIALAMAAEGAKVVVNYSNTVDGAKMVVDQIVAAGGTAMAVRADVSKEADVIAMFQQAIQSYGTVDILINNAGLQQDAAFVDMTLAQWQRVIDINLTGQFLCSREAVREFIRRGVVPERSQAAGKIICISSVHEKIPWAGHCNYASSKGGIMMLMKSMAQELAPYKIRINSIGPGAIKTRINRAAWDTPEAEAKLLQLIPYQRVGEAVDIGQAAAWLASDESDYVNGITLFVDGGMTLYPEFARGG
jgi:glucose 1-dehydrogenase